MDFSCEETIAARASAPGAAQQAIIRVSGAQCREVVERVFSADDEQRFRHTAFPARHTGWIRLAHVRHPVPASVCYWPTTRSYTGQPQCELRLAGAVPLVEATLEGLYSAGARPACAGEFTLRAFLAQRIDLLQAEAVLGVIDAPDEEHLKASLRQLAGGLSGAIVELHEQLLADLSDLEAGLDFVEEDIEFVDRERMRERLIRVESMLRGLARQAASRMHAAPDMRVVLAGLPNSGKSTLFNALLSRDSALVSGHSGTTRDYLTGRAGWAERDFELVDTPGYEVESDDLMRSASRLREDALHGAHVVVWCRATDLNRRGRDQDRDGLARVSRAVARTIVVRTKNDLPAAASDPSSLSVSAVSGDGMERLRREILNAMQRGAPAPHELIGTTAARCADSFQRAREAVSRAALLVAQGGGDELVAAEMRSAVDAIGRVTGRTHSEDILDRIFSRFCIGK